MKLNRREFLALTALTGAPFFLSNQLFAQPQLNLKSPRTPRFFLFLQFSGGMDATLGLDPKVMPDGLDQNDVFLEYRPEDILRLGDLQFGPSAVPLKAVADDIAVINGIDMRRDTGHDSMNLQMRQGDPLHQNDFILRLCDAGGANSSVVSTQNLVSDGIQIMPLLLSVVQNMYNGSSSSGFLTFQNVPGMRHLGAAFDDYKRLQDKAQQMAVSREEIKKIMEEIGFSGDSSGQGNFSEAALWSAALFQNDVFTSSFISSDKGGSTEFDTHRGHPGVHLNAQLRAWEDVTRLIQLFKKTPYREGSLLDSTLILVTSEMSRTPALNSEKGKDHNEQTTSFLLAGAGIRKGITVGGSQLISRNQSQTNSPAHMGRPYDFAQQRVVSDEEVRRIVDWPKTIRPLYAENVFASISKIFGHSDRNSVSTARPIHQLVNV